MAKAKKMTMNQKQRKAYNSMRKEKDKARRKKLQKQRTKEDKLQELLAKPSKQRRPRRRAVKTKAKANKINKYVLAMQKSLAVIQPDEAKAKEPVPDLVPDKSKDAAKKKPKRLKAADIRQGMLRARRAAENPAVAVAEAAKVDGAAAAKAAAAERKAAKKAAKEEKRREKEERAEREKEEATAAPARREKGAAEQPFLKGRQHDDDAASDFSEDSLWDEVRDVHEAPEEDAPPAKRQRTAEGAEGERPHRPVKQPPTAFVRNLPVMAEEDQLQERFEKFGPVKRVLLVRDRATGAPKGSAFVHFEKEAGLEACLQEAQRDLEWRRTLTEDGAEDGSAQAAGGLELMPESRRGLKKDRFRRQSQDVVDMDRPAITWQGFRLLVDRAVSRDEAGQFTRAMQKTKAQKKEDSRNLKFAREGRIRPGTPAAKDIEPWLLDLMEARYAEKKRKLKNPNFVVSKTRLCVHHIPSDVDEKELRRIFLGAVKRYIARHGDPCGDWDKRPVDRKGRRKGEDPTVRQVKLVMDKARQNKPAGFGFVHFKFHEHALIALREVNNNPNIFGPARRLYVEFAVDNMQKLKLLQTKHDRWQQKQQKQAAEPAAAVERKPWVPARQQMTYSEYQKVRKKLSAKKAKPAYMKTQAYQDMVVSWIRRKKMRQAAGGY